MEDYRMKTLTVVLTKETREVRLVQNLNTYDAILDVRPIDPDYTPEVYDLYEYMIARNPIDQSKMHTVKIKGFVGHNGIGDLQIILHVDEFSKLYTIHIEVRAQHIINLLKDLEDFGIDLVSIY